MKYHFDIKRIALDPEAYDAMLISRGQKAAGRRILALDDRRRTALTRSQTAQAERKTISAQIGKAMKSGATGMVDKLKETAAHLKSDIETADHDAEVAELQLDHILLTLPNWPASDVPEGRDETHNIEVKRWGGPGARDGVAHWDMGQVDLGFQVAAKISGARFSMLQGPVARLHRALGQWMLDSHIDRGYREVIVPTVVNAEALLGTAQLPKFSEDLFALHGSGQYLIPTAEVPLTNIHRDEILDSDAVYRYVALSECYRSEAGSAGRDTRGLIRQHQFQKVELVSICGPQRALAEHEYMLESAEAILEALELPYRRVLLCRGDMGFSASKTYDLEVWLPGQNAYREISSISDCGDFQARRLNTRYKVEGETIYAHTLNGSGVAVGRALVAVLENYQTANDVQIPKVLQGYLRGARFLSELESPRVA